MMASAIRWHLVSSWIGSEPRLEEWAALGMARAVKQAPHRTVWQVDLPWGRFHIKSYREGALRWLLRSRARREYRITRAVARRGVATLTPLGWGEGGAASYLI